MSDAVCTPGDRMAYMAQVASEYHGKTERATDSIWISDRRKAYAEALGMTPIGASSAFAELVAVPAEYPDMVLKVVPSEDAGAIYARAILSGVLGSSSMLPVIHAVHEVAGKAFIYMERLCEASECTEEVDEFRLTQASNFIHWLKKDGWRRHSEFIRDPDEADHRDILEWYADFTDWMDDWNSGLVAGDIDFVREDHHTGNLMFRKNGQLVAIDPIWNEY